MQTATNPETGERLYLGDDGQWRPLVTASNPDTGEQVYQTPDGQWAPVTVPDTRPQADRTTGLLGQAGQTASFGFLDEIRGAAGALTSQFDRGGDWEDFRRRYRSYRDDARAEMERFAEENPGASLGASIGGGLLTGLATGGSAAALPLVRSGAQALRSLPFAARFGIGVPVGAATGAAGGAVAGAGAAPEVEDIPSSAAEGAKTGALVGAVAGPAGETIATAGQKVAGALAKPFRSENRADRMVRRAIEAQGGPSEAAGRGAVLGPGATLADTGDQTLALLDSLASQPGQTGAAAGRQLAQRSRRQIGELTEAIGEGRAAEALEATARFRSEQASPIYERAYAAGVNHNDELESVFETVNDLVPGLWERAKRFGAAELKNTGRDELVSSIGDARPSLRGWQFIKRRLDDAVSSAKRAGNNDEARVLAATRRRLLSELDEQSPDYAAARQMWAGAEAFDEALEAGKKFIREPSSATTETLKGLSEIDREGYRIGAIQAIQDMLESQGWTHDATKRFRNPRMEKKLQALLGPDEYSDFMNRLEASRVKQATFAKVGKGSDTARREAFRADQAMANFLADVAMSGNATIPLVTRAAGNIRGLTRAPEAARDLAGQMLLEADPRKQLEIIRQVYAPRGPVVTKGAGLLPAAGAVPLGGLLATRERERN